MAIQVVRQVRRSPLAGFFVKASETPGAISLAVGDVNIPVADCIKEAVRLALAEDFTNYTPQIGIREVRELAVVDFLRDGIPARYENTIVSAGSTVIISSLFFFLCGPGVDVLIPEPAYPAYKDFTLAWGGNPIVIDTEPDGFLLTRAAVKGALRRRLGRTSILVVTSPNNPTGMVWDMEELADLLVDIIISDEAYCGLVYEGSYCSLASLSGMNERIFTIRSCSKTFAMSGLRVGYMTGPQEIMSLTPSYFERFVGSTCSLSLKAAIAAFKQPREAREARDFLLSELDPKRRYVLSWLDELKIPYPVPRGGLYVWADFSKYRLPSVELAERILEKTRVAITPGIAFGERYNHYLRFSYAVVSLEELKLALHRVKDFLDSIV